MALTIIILGSFRASTVHTPPRSLHTCRRRNSRSDQPQHPYRQNQSCKRNKRRRIGKVAAALVVAAAAAAAVAPDSPVAAAAALA
ncbi:hypothetical protein PFISCL1PPCAC_4415, partial [Pristionchus fissidentatus]